MANSIIGALRITLGLDSARFTEGLSEAQKKLQQAGQRFQRVGTQMAAVGAGITATVTAPLIALGIQMTRRAIDAEEMSSAFRVSFGSMADATEDWAARTGQAMGRSRFDLQAMALRFNGLFKAGGEANQMATEMSQRFTVLAQDISSFHNVTEDDALQSLVSGLSGESEPLRRFNVFLTEAGVRAEAARSGIAAMGSELTEQQKIQARYNLILAATAETHGDVIRTSGGTANQLRALQARWEEIQVTLGQKILPLVTPIIAFIGDMATRLSRLPPVMQNVVLIAGGLAAALGPLLIVAGALVAAFGALLPVLGTLLPIIAPIALAIGLAAAAFKLFEKEIKQVADAFAPVVRELWAEAQRTLGPPMRELLTLLSDTVKAMVQSIGNFLRSPDGQALIKWAVDMARVLGPAVIRAIHASLVLIIGALRGMGMAASVLGDVLTGDFGNALRTAGALVRTVTGSMARAFAILRPDVVQNVQRMVQGVGVHIDRLMVIFREVESRINTVKRGFYNLYDAVVGHSYIPDMVEGIAHWMAKLDAGMVRPAQSATDATREAFETLQADVSALFDRLMTDSERAARQMRQDLATIDQSLANGLITESEAADARMRLDTQIMDEGPDLADADRTIGNPFAAMQDYARELNDRMEEGAQRFGDTFADVMMGFANGDWKNTLLQLANDLLRQSLSSLGASLFKSAGGSGGGWMSALASVFGGKGGFGGSKLPAFANGGTILPGGSGGIDSQLTAFWKSPGERVDVYDPNKVHKSGGDTYNFSGNLMTPEFWGRIQSGDRMAAQAGARQGMTGAVGYIEASAPTQQRQDRMFKR